MTEIFKPDMERLQAFQALSNEVHRQMERNVQAHVKVPVRVEKDLDED